MLISSTRLSKYDIEFVVEFYNYRFAYICFQRNTKLEHILRNMTLLSKRRSVTTSYRFRVDNFISSMHGFRDIVVDELNNYLKQNGINERKGRMLYGVYEDLFYLRTDELRDVLNKAILRQENVDIWSLRVSKDYKTEK